MSDLVWGDTVSRDAFEHGLRLGLGRAVLWLRAHPSSDFRDLILHACTHNLAYDRQWEGSREDYLFDLVQASGEPDWYYDQLTSIVTGPRDEEVSYDQILEMMRLWAQHGHPTARQTLYAGFLAAIDADDSSGDEAIIELDGADGLTFVADHLGRLKRVPDEYRYDRFIIDAAKEAGVADPLAVLNAAIEQHPAIAQFLERVAAFEAHDRPAQLRPRDTKVRDYAKLRAWLDEVETNQRSLGFKVWGRNATDSDLLLAAADLVTETNDKRRRALLNVFWERAYPLDPAPLIALVAHADPLISAPAMHRLENIPASEAVRSAALVWLAGNDERAARAVGILEHQFHPGDHALVEALASRVTDNNAWHLFNVRTRVFYEAHPDAASEPRILLTLYEHNPCVMCRESIVRRLLKLNALPDWLAAECRADAGPEIRKMLKEYDNPPVPIEVAPNA